MSQGHPLQKEELKFIWDTRNQFSSVIARHLSTNYSHINGGFRGKDTVADLQREMQDYKTFRDWWQAHFTPTEKRVDATEIQLPDLRKGRKKKNAA